MFLTHHVQHVSHAYSPHQVDTALPRSETASVLRRHTCTVDERFKTAAKTGTRAQRIPVRRTPRQPTMSALRKGPETEALGHRGWRLLGYTTPTTTTRSKARRRAFLPPEVASPSAR